MDLGFESLRDRQLFMNKTIFRKFKKRDSREVIELWNLCKLLVPWNDPKKNIYQSQDSQIYGKRLIDDN